MPYSEKQERFFRARAHGFVPDNPELKRLTPKKAKDLLDESKTTEAEGQKRALRRMMKG